MGRRPKNGENGSGYQRIDPAGRILVPREYRDRLGSDGVWLFPSPPFVVHPHVQLWSNSHLDKHISELETHIKAGKLWAEGMLSFTRLTARHRRIDDVGRVVLPKAFIERAKIVDEVVVCGSSEVMVYSREQFEARETEVARQVKETPPEVQGLVWPL